MALAGMFDLDGRRQHQHRYRKVRRLTRNIDRIARGKRPDRQQRLKALYRELLSEAGTVCDRARALLEAIRRNGCLTPEAMAMEAELETFLPRTLQVCDTARRRVLLEEHVPNGEKLFSIFEPHTQLYKRGKANQEVQFGRLVLICEDGAGFVSHYSVLPRHQGDRDVAVEETRQAQERHGGRIRRASFDRGRLQHDNGHGREAWRDLNTIGIVLRIAECDGEEQMEVRHYISSLDRDAKLFARVVRNHWSIENTLQWSLDMTFREDEIRLRGRYVADNIAWLRRIALCLLKQHPKKQSILPAGAEAPPALRLTTGPRSWRASHGTGRC